MFCPDSFCKIIKNEKLIIVDVIIKKSQQSQEINHNKEWEIY